MAKRKEVRTCSFAIRSKSNGNRVEFKLIGFNGEAEDASKFIHALNDLRTVVGLEAEQEGLGLIVGEGFLCDKLEITVVDEKSDKK